jgi:imidazole glycerol-phosphate synthase subunit HisF
MILNKMKKIRIIPRLDVKGPNVIKGRHLEGLRIVGNPRDLARKYYEAGADEILYIDSVASLYGRNNLIDVVRQASEEIFIPLTVGGGVRSIDDIEKILRAGADKVAINTAAVKNPKLITEGSRIFGSQCIVLSIQAKAKAPGTWEAYVDNGRQTTGLDVVTWAKQAVELGAGEILLTSIDQEGTEKGYDIDLVKKVTQKVPVPVIAAGGCGSVEHAITCLKIAHPDALSIAAILHYNRITLSDFKKELYKEKFNVRYYDS